MASTKVKELFPKLTSGGYSCNIRFMTEMAGEMFFNSEWSVQRKEKNCFRIVCQVTYRGDNDWNALKPTQTIGRFLKPGVQVLVSPKKWGRTGSPRYLPQQTITIQSVEDAGGTLIVTFA